MLVPSDPLYNMTTVYDAGLPFYYIYFIAGDGVTAPGTRSEAEYISIVGGCRIPRSLPNGGVWVPATFIGGLGHSRVYSVSLYAPNSKGNFRFDDNERCVRISWVSRPERPGLSIACRELSQTLSLSAKPSPEHLERIRGESGMAPIEHLPPSPLTSQLSVTPLLLVQSVSSTQITTRRCGPSTCSTSPSSPTCS